MQRRDAATKTHPACFSFAHPCTSCNMMDRVVPCPKPAFYLQIRVMCLCNLLTDSQAQPVAARFPGTALVNPIKRLFDPCHFLFRDTRSAVSDTDAHFSLAVLAPDPDAFPCCIRHRCIHNKVAQATSPEVLCLPVRSSPHIARADVFPVPEGCGKVPPSPWQGILASSLRRPFSSPNRSSNSRLRFSRRRDSWYM